MNNSLKRLAVVVTICAMMLCLAGCSGSFDASTFVSGHINSSYLGVFDKEYLNILVNDEEELLEDYEAGLVTEAEYFFFYFDIAEESISPEMKTEVAEMYRKIYAKTKYEVGNTTKSGDSYLVSVTIYPIDIISKITEEDADEFLLDWDNRTESGEFEDMTDDEFETLWARGIIDLAQARLGSIGYLEPETISVQVITQSSAGEEYYIISENDTLRIDELIIKY